MKVDLDKLKLWNLSKCAKFLGAHATMDGVWTSDELRRLIRVGVLPWRKDKSSKGGVGAFKLTVSECKGIKEKMAQFEYELRERGPGVGFIKPMDWGDDWFTLEEVAAFTGKTKTGVKDRIESGDLKAEWFELEEKDYYTEPRTRERVTRIYRVSIGSLMEFIENMKGRR